MSGFDGARGRGWFLQDLSWLCRIHQSRAWMQPLENREKLLPHKDRRRRKKSVPISFSPVWSLICRLWFKIRIKSPWGPEPTCSPYPFVQKVTKDNRKRLEPAVPRSPNLPSSSCFFCSSLPFFFYPLLLFCTPLSSPISSSLWLLFPPFLPVNLCLPATPDCKGSLCTALMERLLSNKDAHAVEQRQQIGSIVASLRRLFHHEGRTQGGDEKEMGGGEVPVQFICRGAFFSRKKVGSLFNGGKT